MILLVSNVNALDAEPSDNWDFFSDWFVGLFGVEPDLQLKYKDNGKQKYKLKGNVDIKDFDFELKTVSKKANLKNIYFEIEEKVCKRKEAKTIIDEINGTNTFYEDIEYPCSKKLRLSRQELIQKIIDNQEFIEFDVIAEFGKPPKEMCDSYREEGLIKIGSCEEQIVDFIPIYNGRKYIEYAKWLQEGGSWNGVLSQLTENITGALELSSSGGAVLFDGFDTDGAANVTNWENKNNGGSYTVTSSQLILTSPGDGQEAILSTKSESFSFQVDSNNCFIWSNAQSDLDDGSGSVRGSVFGSSSGEVEVFRIDVINSFKSNLLAGTNITLCISNNGTSLESISLDATTSEPSDYEGGMNWDLSSLSGDYEFSMYYKRNVAGSSTLTIDDTYLSSPPVSFDEGSFTSAGFGNGVNSFNWDALEFLGFNNVEVRSSSDNSSWSSWAK